ncbi:MAG: beta-ketoacyl-[acyl-carrier-protein] synthase family protein [Kofleriaceae bacterium]
MPRRTSAPPLAITGLGLICPLGNTVAVALANARLGTSGIRPYQSPWADPDDPLLRHRVGGTVEGFVPDAVLEPRLAERHEPATLYALAAAAEALAQAGLPDADGGDRIGVALGAGLPGAELWHRALAAAGGDRRPGSIARMAAIAITGNAAVGQLALRHGLRGPSLGVANACAAGTSAVALAMDQLRLGRADAMLVGGCESSMRSLMTYASFIDAGMHVTRDPTDACTPFARDRRGFVLAEGAGMLVVERLDRARARGARVLGLLAGAATTNDAHHVISPEPTGAAWARTITLALADAGVEPDEVDAISAHATATPAGDLAETRAIKRVFGARAGRLAVSATKSMHGHAFGAAGAIELALAVAAMAEGVVLPTIGLRTPDPACDLDYVPHAARQRAVGVLVKHGFGAGGVATALVVRHPDATPVATRSA